MERSRGLMLLIVALSGSLLASICCFAANNDVAALMAFKRSVFEDPFSVLSDWNAFGDTPCNWTGIFCSSSNLRVVSLNLSGSSLKGFLTPELGSMNGLQELILGSNLLLGTIPSQIGMLTSLTMLDLSSNHLSGPIPPEIGNLSNAQNINFHFNGLTGTIPPELGNLNNLIELRMDRNRLRGPIPDSTHSNLSQDNVVSQAGLCRLPHLKVADFSYNFLTGIIPPCFNYLPRNSFQGNCFQNKDYVLQRSIQQCGASAESQGGSQQNNKHIPHRKHRQPEWLWILEIASVSLVLVFFIGGASASAVRMCSRKSFLKIPWKRPQNWKDNFNLASDFEMLKMVPRLSRQDLEVACEDFSNIIGSYPDSIVYKGTLQDGCEVAVISLCIPEDHWSSYHEFYIQAKVADLARLAHENVAKFVGFCQEEEPFLRILVLEYASNGTLYEYLHYGESCQLTWIRRMKIAIGIARGLRYLHTELQPPCTLCELNSASVYLTEDFTPKLVDFECWRRLFSKSEKNSGYTMNGGSFYCVMDSLEQRHMEVQGNTYAFGVLLLELISGRPPYCKDRGCLVNWATEYLQYPEKFGNLVDPGLQNVRANDVAVICSVVSLCVEPNPTKRPSMQIICSVLENGIDTSASSVLKDSPLAWAEALLS